MSDKITCSICSKELSDRNCFSSLTLKYGNNAWPVNDGRCCDTCDKLVVTPRRLSDSIQEETTR